jgi:hypothetical protein
MPKVHEATEGERGNDEQRKQAQCLKVLLGENVIKHMLHQKWQHAIRGAKQHHADNGSGKTWE